MEYALRMHRQRTFVGRGHGASPDPLDGFVGGHPRNGRQTKEEKWSKERRKRDRGERKGQHSILAILPKCVYHSNH